MRLKLKPSQIACAWLSALLFMFALATARGDAFTDSYTNSGTLVLTQLTSAPFPHPARAGGHTYQGKQFPAAEHYSDSTAAIFVPNNFPTNGPVDFVVHFHGWRNSVTNVLRQFRLIEQFAAGGKAAVLVVPQGPRNAPDSFAGKLEDADGFKHFLTDALAATPGELRHRGIGRVILSGHSGGYRAIAQSLAHGGLAGHVREVWLFDALYAETDSFLAWHAQHGGRLLNIYTDNGGTKRETTRLMSLLKERNEPLFAREKQPVSISELSTNRWVFWLSELSHDGVVAERNTFRDFLAASVLSDLPKVKQ
ncbi:MAG: hypothetical protein HY300_07475 [Verrucomicrobia bacterium]|nr:hypothetical protein [Verrucomicrobiota bacterium]